MRIGLLPMRKSAAQFLFGAHWWIAIEEMEHWKLYQARTSVLAN